MTCKDCFHEKVCNNLIQTGLPYNDNKFPADKFCNSFKDKSKIVELPCKPIPVLMEHSHSDAYCPFCGENLSGYYGDNNAPDIIPCLSCGEWLDNTKSMTKEEAEKALKEYKK